MIDLEKARNECNKILTEMRADKDNRPKGAVNWADLRCIDVLYARSSYGFTSLIFEIEEADPRNGDFCKAIWDRLVKLYPQKDLEIEVKTEW